MIDVTKALHSLRNHTGGIEAWRTAFSDNASDLAPIGLHLAIFSQPYLDLILRGEKTIESRFSAVKVPPYGDVHCGDLILVKEVSGPVVGAFRVGSVWHHTLTPERLTQLRDLFGHGLCAEEDTFWNEKKQARYATLMEVVAPIRISPINIDKRDRRGWVNLNGNRSASQLALDCE